MKGSFHENVMSLRVQEKAEFLLQSCIKFTLITLCNVCSVHRGGGGGGGDVQCIGGYHEYIERIS